VSEWPRRNHVRTAALLFSAILSTAARIHV
jgi:hypothetical protein